MKTKINHLILISAFFVGLSLGVVNASVEVINAPGAYYSGIQMQGLKFEDNDGHVIMMLDRNLGAYTTGAGTSATSNSYGFYYQWGNDYGFQTEGDLLNVSSSQIDAMSYGPLNHYNNSTFIAGFDNWASSNDSTNLRGGENDNKNSEWGKNIDKDLAKNRQGPCPAGYHVPSAGEWNELLKYWVADYKAQGNSLNLQNNSESDLNYFLSNSTAVEAFYKDFYIPYAGARSFQDLSIPGYKKGFLYGQGEQIALWTSSPSNSGNSQSFFLNTNGIKGDNKNARSVANPIRCFFDPQPVTHRSNAGITYIDTNGKEFTGIGTITFKDGVHEITILDRNLGAEKAGRNSDSYGYHFQWGNNHGFEACLSPNNCSTFPGGEGKTQHMQVDVSGYGWNNPYVSTDYIVNYDGKWNTGNSNLWDESEQAKRQGPCPAGYHVPSVNEWNDLVKYMLPIYTGNGLVIEPSISQMPNSEGLYGVVSRGQASVLSNDLIIPYAGGRNRVGEMYDMGGWSIIGSSSMKGESKVYVFKSNNDGFGVTFDDDYANASSIRCFKDTYAEENKPLILEYETNGGTKIQSQTIPSGEKGFLPGYTTHKSGAVFEGWYNSDYTIKYELDGSNTFQFKDLIMSDSLADGSGIVKLYAKWRDIVSHNTGADITYIDTNGKEFTGIGTITFYDGEHEVTMLDRNLGAEKAGTGLWDDERNNVYDGYHFQRGNNYGFKACRDYGCTSQFPGGETTTSTQVDASGYGWDNPYVNSGFITNDGGVWDISNTGLRNENEQVKRQGPCPAGYHIPSITEWNNLLKYWVAVYTGNGGTFLPWEGVQIDDEGLYGIVLNQDYIMNDLFIGFAGFRNKIGSMQDKGSWAVLGSASPLDSAKIYTFKIGYGGFGVTFKDVNHADAVSIRCFKDENAEGNNYVLSYETNGGTKIQSQTIPSGNKGFLPGYSSYKSGAELLGWFNEDGTEQYEFESQKNRFNNLVVNSDVTIYAKWGYKVAFLDRSGDEIEIKAVAEGDKAIAPVLQTETGYAMVRYDEDGNFFDIKNNLITGNITLKGKEELAIYTMTFDTDGGTEISSITGFYNSSITKPLNPTKDGYTFNGWDREIPDNMPAEDITIKALWTKNGGGGGGGGGGGSGGGGSSTKKSEDNTGSIVTGSVVSSGSDASKVDDKLGDNSVDDIKNNSGNDKVVEGNGYTKEFNDAYHFAYINGITTMPTIQKANMDGKLTRIAMAKMLSQYAINILGMKPDEMRNNQFNDVSEKLDSDYDNGITLAYQLGIMGINMPDNNFRPNDEVTRAEFATALSRMLYSTPDGNPYYVTHLAKLKEEGIIKDDNSKMLELRGYVMIMLMRTRLK